MLNNCSSDNRFFFIFEPDPVFFKNGVDMDEVLQHKENPFRSIRTLWSLSCIKMDDDESEQLYKIIIKKNELDLCNKNNQFEFNDNLHNSLAR